MSRLERVRTSSRELERVQDNVDRALDIPDERVIITGVTLLAAGTTAVPHTLGRRLRGWNLARLRGNSVVWDDQDSNKSPDRTLLLKCSADVVADIEVYT